MLRFVTLSLLLAGCEQDLVSAQPDAAPDGAVTLPAGLDWSCLDTPWPTTAPDPLAVAGNVTVAGATVELHAVADDALLAQGTSGSSASTTGKYSIQLTTGGLAKDIYRKATKSGYSDVYAFDSFPVFQERFMYVPLQPPADPSSVDVFGEHPDATKGSVWIVINDCTLPPNDVHLVAHATVDVPPGARVLYLPPDGIIGDNTKLLTETTAAGAVIVDHLVPGTYDLALHVGGYTYRSRAVKVFANAMTVSVRNP